MSAKSLRKVVHRRINKERAQPAHRTKLGLLEKHKDYKQRAMNYHRKEDRLQALQEKAALKNPDEFYFAMNKAKINEVFRLQLDFKSQTYSVELISCVL